jgi:uncharacterized protein
MERVATRLLDLPREVVRGREFPIAIGLRVRFLGLAHLGRDEAGPGLLIPRCSSVHTFGMRFALDLCFLGDAGELLAIRRKVPARRFVLCRRASAVLEIPATEGGEFSSLGT